MHLHFVPTFKPDNGTIRPRPIKVLLQNSSLGKHDTTPVKHAVDALHRNAGLVGLVFLVAPKDRAVDVDHFLDAGAEPLSLAYCFHGRGAHPLSQLLRY